MEYKVRNGMHFLNTQRTNKEKHQYVRTESIVFCVQYVVLRTQSVRQ